MNRTRHAALSIHAVLAASILLMGPLPYACCLLLVRSCTRIKHISARREVLGVEREAAPGAIREPVLEREGDGAEGELLPGNGRFLEHHHLEALLPGLEFEAPQPGAEEDVHLVHTR